MTVKVKLQIPDINTYIREFEHIRVYRSTTGRVGLFHPVTGAVPAAASMISTHVEEFVFTSDTTLALTVDSDAPVNATFLIGTFTAADIVSDINIALGATIATEVTGAVVLTSPTTGLGSFIGVTGTDAILEFPVAAYGMAQNIELEYDTYWYTFLDNVGNQTNWYEYALIAADTEVADKMSTWPIQGAIDSYILEASRCACSLKLALTDGTPLMGKTVSFAYVGTPQTNNGYAIGLAGHEVMEDTDRTGTVSVILLRGATVRVSIPDAAIVREVVVPDATTCDLLTQIATVSDNFVVQNPQAVPLRRSTP